MTANNDWIKIKGGKHNKRKSPSPTYKQPFYITLSNQYSSLPQFAADPPHDNSPTTQPVPNPNPIPSTFKHKAQHKALARKIKCLHLLTEDAMLDQHITWAKDEHTAAAKGDTTAKQCLTIDNSHKGGTMHAPTPSIIQTSRNLGFVFSTSLHRAAQKLSSDHHVHFSSHTSICHYDPNAHVPMITYDSGAGGHYLCKADRIAARLPILRPSSRRVSVTNGSTSTTIHVSKLPFPQLSPSASHADSFHDFPQSLMSVGKTCDDGTISIFTQDGGTIHKEHDVLITCRGEPLLIGVRNDRGRYRIPLVQHRGQWQPRTPSKKARQALIQALSVYDLPSTEQAIRWMHAVCGYPVKCHVAQGS